MEQSTPVQSGSHTHLAAQRSVLGFTALSGAISAPAILPAPQHARGRSRVPRRPRRSRGAGRRPPSCRAAPTHTHFLTVPAVVRAAKHFDLAQRECGAPRGLHPHEARPHVQPAGVHGVFVTHGHRVALRAISRFAIVSHPRTLARLSIMQKPGAFQRTLVHPRAVAGVQC